MVLDDDGVPLPDPHSSFALIGSSFIGSWLHAQRSRVRGTLLDLGAGNQPYRVWYERQVERSIAVDMVAAPGLGALCSASRLPFADGTFDTVMATEVLEHVAEVDAAVAEVRRVLRPGGHFLATVPFVYPIHEAPYDFWRFTEHGLRALCDRHGLEVVELEAKGGVGMLAAHVLSNGLPRALDGLGAALGVGPISRRASIRRMLTGPQVQLMRRRADRRTIEGSARFATIGYLLVARRV